MRSFIKALLTGVFAKIALAVGIIALGFFGFNILVATSPVIEPQPRQEVINRVEVVTVALTDTRPTHTAYGTVTPTRRADLRFAIGGEIAMIAPLFRNGAVVEEGEELARLDTELLTIARDEIIEQQRAEGINITAQRLNITALETQYTLRGRQFDRINQMNAQAIVSATRLDESAMALSQAENALSQAENALAQAQSRIKQFDLALMRAERNLREASLLAPFTGVLSAVDVGVGKIVSTTTNLGVMTDTSSLEASFIVPPEIYAASTSLMGEAVQINWTAGGRSVLATQGRIIRAEGSVSAAEGGGRLYASLPADTAIPSGAFVEVEIPSILLQGVAVLPDTALFDNDTVYVVENDRATPRLVQILGRSQGAIFVRGELADGEQVITTRIPSLGAGVRVEVVAS